MDAPNLSINRYPAISGNLWNHFSACPDKLLGNALAYTSSSLAQRDSWESNLSINRYITSYHPFMEWGGNLWNHFSACPHKLLGNALAYTSSSLTQKDSC
ncbi:hypothetical protein LIER_43835 [Lithospermum erythrorhizon]|uniref:Uncharacterized protein n=1 Tax=Lithospermum erythrorhizon TaxID=34254 RepID=A0AAV3QZQ4_LITER